MRLQERFRRLTLWNKFGTIGAFASVVGLVLAIWNQAPQQTPLASFSTPIKHPDAGLGFYGPRNPQFRIVNLSNVVLREAKYQFLLYDMDLPGADQPYLNLRIPVKIVPDYIRPKGNLGPWKILDLSPRKELVDREHRLFGYAQIQCPNCTHFRKYWVFTDLGLEKGWYAQIPEQEHDQIYPQLAMVIHGNGDPLPKIETLVPVEKRISFG